MAERDAPTWAVCDVIRRSAGLDEPCRNCAASEGRACRSMAEMAVKAVLNNMPDEDVLILRNEVGGR